MDTFNEYFKRSYNNEFINDIRYIAYIINLITQDILSEYISNSESDELISEYINTDLLNLETDNYFEYKNINTKSKLLLFIIIYY